MVSSSFLVQYRNNLKKTRELEELQEYYNAEKYQEIVNLLAEVISAYKHRQTSSTCLVFFRPWTATPRPW